MKKLLLLLTILSATTLLHAQDLSGSWYGQLVFPGAKLRINFHVKADGANFTATMDSPDQGAAGIPTDRTIVSGNEITIEAAKLGMTYKGSYVTESKEIKGTFTQGPTSIPMSLSRNPVSMAKAEDQVKTRPQDPVAFPYKQEEVTFKNTKGGNTLSGTLTLPSSGKVSRIVVLISGSGPQDRNEEMIQFNHRPFLVWSDYLTKKGIAVLRYDDRGVGKSTGSFAKANSADFADDAEAAVEFIKSRPDLKSLKIGLIGHSEGGMIAPIVAGRNAAVKFIVLLAGPGIPIRELMVDQGRDQLRVSGASDSVMNSAAAINRKIYAEVANLKALDDAAFKPALDAMLMKEFRALDTDNTSETVMQQRASSISEQVGTPWFRYFLAFNPQDYLSKLTIPVLAINGTLDTQVASEPNLKGIKESLTKAGNKKFEVRAMPGLNHLFQLAKTGAVAEYSELEETVNPEALEIVGAWVQKI